MSNAGFGMIETYLIKESQDTSPKTLFVTDREGNIVVSNSFTALTLGISLDELKKENVSNLMKKGLYDYSTTLEAIKQKKEITNRIRTRMGFDILSTSTPLFDANGEINLVVTVSDRIKDYSPEHVIKNQKGLVCKQNFNSTKSDPNNEIIAESQAMKNILKACDQIAPTDCKVLLFGESGTGKEVLSNYIHNQSKRAEKAFISVNCAAIPESLFESELFGHEKGSFTGATVAKKGLIELAEGGTLFLDEISEMPLEMQAKLLRILETPEIRRVGGTESNKVNFRLITATNKDLSEMVEQGKFRQDLFYRINVIPIHIPPLRERHQDIVGLVNKFLNQFNQLYGKDYYIRANQYNHLLTYHWPGNIRELKNYIERLVIVDDGYLGINEDHCNEDVFIDFSSIIASNRCNWPTLKDFLKNAEIQYIQRILDECNGKKGEAAEQLGIYRTVLYRKLKDYETNQINEA